MPKLRVFVLIFLALFDVANSLGLDDDRTIASESAFLEGILMEIEESEERDNLPIEVAAYRHAAKDAREALAKVNIRKNDGGEADDLEKLVNEFKKKMAALREARKHLLKRQSDDNSQRDFTFTGQQHRVFSDESLDCPRKGRPLKHDSDELEIVSISGGDTSVIRGNNVGDSPLVVHGEG
ncbi:MAG: hypothetical protein LBB34_03845 [Holosporales bacterium]|jgi:hypothetical protein|nr:hypothetical protein [Holosporales bacterium]